MPEKYFSLISLYNLIKTGRRTLHLSFWIAFIVMSVLMVNQTLGAESKVPKTGHGENTLVQTTGFTSLFNGKDLTGWGYLNKKQDELIFESFEGKNQSKDGRFKVIDGILTVNPNNYVELNDPSYITLWTAKEYPEDFYFTIEFRAAKNADSGIFFRGIQLQCRDYLVVGPYKNLKNYRAQEWNQIEVVVKGNFARCTCNDEILEEALKLPATGPLGLEADRGQVEYRNIQIKELK
jgi:hypothetical protein